MTLIKVVVIMEYTTVAVDKETLAKLSVIAQKSSLTKTVLITSYIEALYKLIREARPDTQKISLTNFEIDLKLGILKQGFANLFDIGELPLFIRDFYGCLKFLEDAELRGEFPTLEELVKKGFNKEDAEILLAEQKVRFSKKVLA